MQQIPLRTDNQDLHCTVAEISKLFPKIMKPFFVLEYQNINEGVFGCELKKMGDWLMQFN